MANCSDNGTGTEDEVPIISEYADDLSNGVGGVDTDNEDEESEDDEDFEPFTCDNEDLETMAEEMESLHGIYVDQDDQDEYMKGIPTLRIELKMDLLKKKLIDRQKVLAKQHAQKVKSRQETYNMNDELRKRYLNGKKGIISSIDVTDEDLLDQFTASSLQVPFLLDIEKIIDAAIKQSGSGTGVLEPASPRNISPVESTPASLQERLRTQIKNTEGTRTCTKVPQNAHERRSSSPMNNYAKQRHNQVSENPAPTRFSTPTNSVEDDDFTPKIGSRSQLSTRVNALSPVLTATNSKVVAGNGAPLQLYTSAPKTPTTTATVPELTAAALKRFGTTMTPAPSSATTTNHSPQKRQESRVINSRPIPCRQLSPKNVINITPAIAASLTGLTRSKTLPASAYRNFNGTTPVSLIRKGSPANLAARKRSGGRGAIRTMLYYSGNNSPNFQPTGSPQFRKALPISIVPQTHSSSSGSRIRPSISPNMKPRDPTNSAILNFTSQREESGPVITNVISQAQNPVILLNGPPTHTLTPISIAPTPTPTSSQEIRNLSQLGTMAKPADAKRVYEEIIHSQKPIRPKPSDAGKKVRIPSSTSSTLLKTRPATAIDALAWTPSISSSSSNPQIVSANGPTVISTCAGVPGPDRTTSTLSRGNASEGPGQNIFVNGNNNVLLTPTTALSIYSTNRILTHVSSTLYDAQSQATTPSNETDPEASAADEDEILGL